MIKSKSSWKVMSFYLLFFMFTSIVSIIIYKDYDFPYAFPILIAYAIYLIFILVYFVITSLWRAKNLRKSDWLKRLGIFIGYFSLFLIISLIIELIIKNEPLDFYSLIPIPFGLALGFSFFDLVFKTKDN